MPALHTSADATVLRGRRISRVRMNRFSDGRGGWTTAPHILLDNGDVLRFVVEETDGDGYGVLLVLDPKE